MSLRAKMGSFQRLSFPLALFAFRLLAVTFFSCGCSLVKDIFIRRSPVVVGVLLVAIALVVLTSFVISALGTSAFFSFVSLSAVFGAVVFSTRTAAPLIKRLSEKNPGVGEQTNRKPG
jgi:hypothetical protein